MSFESMLAAHEAEIRLGAFMLVLAVMAGWEALAPRRRLALARRRRWTANLGVAVLDAIVVRLLFPAAAAGMAALAAERGWGFFNTVDMPYPVTLVASIVALDFAVYLQHVLFHALPALWRLHRVHHADLDFDVTTGARFHPLEIVLSLLVKFAAIAALGAPASAVLLFEIILNATAMFNHGNVRIPEPVDRLLRWIVVTPDMHRVHHSAARAEADSNFGFNLSLWDRLLGTYRAQPAEGHDSMTIGIAELRDPRHCASFAGILALPFTAGRDDAAPAHWAREGG